MITEEDMIRLEFYKLTGLSVFRKDTETDFQFRLYQKGFEAGRQYEASNDEKGKDEE